MVKTSWVSDSIFLFSDLESLAFEQLRILSFMEQEMPVCKGSGDLKFFSII